MEQFILTVLGGVFVYVIGQYVQNFILQPLKEFKLLLGKIHYKLVFLSNLITNPIVENKQSEVQTQLRDLACDLQSQSKALSNFSGFFCVELPKKENVDMAVSKLIRISNSAGNVNYLLENADDIDDIKQVLKLN